MFDEIDKHIKNKSKVISLQYGLGEITGCFRIYDGVDDYLEVRYFNDGKIRYFCTKHMDDVRLVSARRDIEAALKVMSAKLNDTSQENHFSEKSITFLDKNVLFIVKRVVNLFRKEKLSKDESILLSSTINSLVYEVETVFAVDNNCARGIVGDYMKCA